MEVVVAAYDRAQAEELVRTCTPQEVLDQLPRLVPAHPPFALDRDLLNDAVRVWESRALGPMPLRDALIVDPQRARPFYDQLCARLTSETWRGEADPAPGCDLSPDDPWLVALCGTSPPLAALVQRACDRGLALAAWPATTTEPRFPLPPDLEHLLPAPPAPLVLAPPVLEPPGPRRRLIASGMAALGMLLLFLPMVIGQMPTRPAGLPLALITLALLVGIRAGWQGYLGSLLLWLVPNLPEFRAGSPISVRSVALAGIGLLCLLADRRIRMMWRLLLRLGRPARHL